MGYQTHQQGQQDNGDAEITQDAVNPQHGIHHGVKDYGSPQ
jgi:hypothetical protein